MSAARRKGSSWESACVEYLRANGFPHAERRVTNGAKDRGDISGVIAWTIECKSEKSITLASYMAEAETEATNAGTRWYAAFVKRRGKTDPGQGYAVLPISVLVALIREQDQ